MKPSCFIRFLVFTLLATLAIATGAATQGQALALPAPLNLDVVGSKQARRSKNLNLPFKTLRKVGISCSFFMMQKFPAAPLS